MGVTGLAHDGEDALSGMEMQSLIDGLPQEVMPFPFDGDTHRMTMGLRALDPTDWTSLDGLAPALLAERRALLRGRPQDVLGRLPGTATAERELLDRIVRHLTSQHAGIFQPVATGIANRLTGHIVDVEGDDPMAAINALTVEDHCLLHRVDRGWILASAILCFPNRWTLSEKLGQPLLGVHAPVPGYDRVLANPVDRFLDGLRPGKGVWRTNWALNDDPALYQPRETAHCDPHTDITPANAAERLYLRVERQTLVKLADSGAVVFGIRTHQRPIGALSGWEARHFAAVLRSVPVETARYKGLHRTGDLALAVLDRVA